MQKQRRKNKSILNPIFVTGIVVVLFFWYLLGICGIIGTKTPSRFSEEKAKIDVFCKEYGNDVETVNDDGQTLLYRAVRSNQDIAIIKFLVSEGADVNAAENFLGRTPLHWAAIFGNLEVAKFLVSQGANVNVGKNGDTPLQLAKKKGDTAVIEYLSTASAMPPKEPVISQRKEKKNTDSNVKGIIDLSFAVAVLVGFVIVLVVIFIKGRRKFLR